MNKISSKVRNEIYKFLGFEFNKIEPDNLNYSSIIKAINMGIKFEEICTQLSLDPEKVSKYLIKYVLHQLYIYSLTLSSEELKMVDKFEDEPIGNTTFEDIIIEEFFSNPKECIDYYSNPLFKNISDLKRENIATNLFLKDIVYEPLEDDKVWCQYFRKSGTFFLLYADYCKRYRKVLNKQVYKITNLDLE
ncbi:hypothetical protein HNR63_000046 [Anoxybacillus kamchatkensis]|uniref:hypothetical protein n=1 Tax=Anoxybacillus ayderensis TaxID=265546 RepID=UPI0015EBC509|nr:hypothetical protein [Anoxybacillus ayderensis]MBA2877019.1 hypothetical protein [Anoxybacillus ayderensis]